MNIRTLIRQNRNLSARIAELEATVKALEALSVTKIMIDISPGMDGMGEEVYAKSVSDVEQLIGRLGEKAENYDLETRLLSCRATELTAKVTELEVEVEVANWKGATRKLHIELIDWCGRNQILTEQVDAARAALELCKFDSLNMSIEDWKFVQDAYAKLQGVDGCAARTIDSAIARLTEALQVNSQTEELDEDHPLWCVNEQIKGLLEGLGASEDQDDVLKFFRSSGLPETTVKRIHEAICCSRDTERLNVIERKHLLVGADGGFDEDLTYQVFEVTGNRNDREWNLIGQAETLREAIDNARKGMPT